jgi:hypothetical protein
MIQRRWKSAGKLVSRSPSKRGRRGSPPSRDIAKCQRRVKSQNATWPSQLAAKGVLQANGVNGNLRWFPADVSVSYLDGSISYPKSLLTAVLGKELHRLCVEVSAARIHVANADGLALDINDFRLSKEATASQQDGQSAIPVISRLSKSLRIASITRRITG